MHEESKLNIDESICTSSKSTENVIILKNAKERKILRWIYYFCLFVLCTVLIVQLQKAIRYYLSYPTYTKSHLVRQSDAEFPALSICSDSSAFKKTILQVRLEPLFYFYYSFLLHCKVFEFECLCFLIYCFRNMA